ncbi:MAG: hypothetical protein JWN38_1133 [Candidatus Saccharibacteria bacterium]|nr:hypothetical protein [Candidatus Saccharibacteria bacterium]
MREELWQKIKDYDRERLWVITKLKANDSWEHLQEYHQLIKKHAGTIAVHGYREPILSYFDSIEGDGPIVPVPGPTAAYAAQSYAKAMQRAASIAGEPIFTVTDRPDGQESYRYAFVPGGSHQEYMARLFPDFVEHNIT